VNFIGNLPGSQIRHSSNGNDLRFSYLSGDFYL
jgi:hypothetical protein